MILKIINLYYHIDYTFQTLKAFSPATRLIAQNDDATSGV